MEIDWTKELAQQLDWHWREQLRPRLDGLTDEEYFWEPVPGMWNIRRRGTSAALEAGGSGEFTADFAFPEPSPAPVTTIAWRMAHLTIGCFGMRAASHFGGPAMSYETYDYPGTAADALERLDAAYALWMDGVRKLTAEDLKRPVGPAEGPWAASPMASLVSHINREALHHGAEIALLRDLYQWKEK
ncbi:MAG: DinB family protein [Trebonia sp.]